MKRKVSLSSLIRGALNTNVMWTVIVIIGFICFLVGMGVSVWAFGTGGKRANVFKDIYYSIEEADGVGILYTKSGEYSAILKTPTVIMTSPV